MKIKYIYNSYKPMQRLCNIRLHSYKKSIALAVLLRLISDYTEDFLAEARKQGEFFKVGADGSGDIQSYNKEIYRLENEELDFKPEVIELSEGDFADELPSPADMAALDGFVSFS